MGFLNGVLNKVKAGGVVLAITSVFKSLGWDEYLAPGWQDVLQWVLVMISMYAVPETKGTVGKLKQRW